MIETFIAVGVAYLAASLVLVGLWALIGRER